ncbi:kinase-like protein, partial [Pluteus cervinus]
VSTNLKAIFADGKRYSQLLSYRNEQAQLLLDILQALLDNPDFDVTFKSDLVVAMYKLSQRTSMYPRCFILMGVTLQGDRPIAEGSYGEIWKGQFGMHTVSLKVIKLYIKEPMERLFKVCFPFNFSNNGNINTFLRKNPNANRSSLISDIACGLAYLHENNVVHGDLKGANILVTRSPHRACLADFGLASICKPESRDHSIFTSTAPRGTLRWLAPELMMDEAIRSTRASDVYAFACVCYEVFTGNYPFPEIPRDTVVVLKVMRQERPNRPKDPLSILESRGLTDKVWDMMEECWQHDPTRRPTSAKLVRLL